MDGEVVQSVVFVLQLQDVAIGGKHVGELEGPRVEGQQRGEAFLIRAVGLLDVVHVGIDVTHAVVGHTLSELVVALHGVVVHLLYLLQARIGLAGEVVGIHEDGPRLVIVLPVADGGEEFEGGLGLLVDGVAEVAVVEVYELHDPGVGLLLTVALVVALGDEVVEAF